ncbi:MAG: glutathione binding-like protein [Dokdonella sp.]
MKLYYRPGACSLADHIVLEWIGKPYEAQKMDHASIKSPEYLKINPNGAVPALQIDGNDVLLENVAILGYLADLNPQLKLAGDGTPRSRAEVMRWLAFLNSDVHKSFLPMFGPGRFIADESKHEELQANARTKLRTLFEQLDAHLQGRQWLAGIGKSIADPYLFVIWRWAKAKGVDLGGLENLAKFGERMATDPGVQNALKQEGLGST